MLTTESASALVRGRSDDLGGEMKIRVLKPVMIRGIAYAPGVVTAVSDADGRTLVLMGKAEAVDGAPVEAAVMEPGDEVADAPAARRARPRKRAPKAQVDVKPVTKKASKASKAK